MNPDRETAQHAPDEPDEPTQTTTRPADLSDEKPPMIAPARGPMNQTTPDVPTGSTPLTRHDD